MDGLQILGILCIIIFILYLIKVIKSGPYIVNFRKGDTTRIQKIIITSANLISNKGKSIMSKFVPNIVQINMGDTVTFINKDKLRHSVEIINPNLHNSKILEINDKFSITIDQEGRIPFRSSLYPDVIGGIIEILPRNKGLGFLNKGIFGQIRKMYSNLNEKECENKSKVESKKIRSEFVNIKAKNVKSRPESKKVQTESTPLVTSSWFEIIGNYLKFFKILIQNIFKSILSIFKAFANIITKSNKAIILCTNKGFKECAKHTIVRQVGGFFALLTIGIIASILIYKKTFAQKISIPIFTNDEKTMNIPINFN